MKLENYFSGLEELNQEDLLNLNRGFGESSWYWLNYGIVATAYAFVSFTNSARELNSGLVGGK